jgi:hypothetical protein
VLCMSSYPAGGPVGDIMFCIVKVFLPTHDNTELRLVMGLEGPCTPLVQQHDRN